MAVIEYDSYKQKLLAMSDTFENLQKALDIESAKHEIARLEAEAHEDGFWNDIERSQANQMRTKQLQNKVHRFEKLVSTRDDLLALIDMGNEMDDASLLPELEEGFADLEKRIEEVRLTTLLSGEYDNCNAILTFHAGAGGTEAQDWTQMLYRMYMQWANKHGFEFEMMDYIDGEEAHTEGAQAFGHGLSDIAETHDGHFQTVQFDDRMLPVAEILAACPFAFVADALRVTAHLVANFQQVRHDRLSHGHFQPTHL